MEPETPAEQPFIEMPKRSKLPMVIFATVIVSALIAGGAVYAFQKKQNDATATDLQEQIDVLKAQITNTTATPTPSPVATTSPTASTSPTATAAAVTTCLSTNLDAALIPSTGGGAAGTYYYNVVLTNTGTTSCTVSGAPSITSINSTGTEVGTSIPTTKVTTEYTLKSGGKIYSLVGFPNPGNFDTGTCKDVKSLVIYLAGSSTGSTISDVDTISTYTAKYCGALDPAAFSNTAK